jgi:hypothetical protein
MRSLKLGLAVLALTSLVSVPPGRSEGESQAVTINGPPDTTFETGYNSAFNPQVRYDTGSTALCCSDGFFCKWVLIKSGASSGFSARGTSDNTLKGPGGSISGSGADAPIMTMADANSTYELRLNLKCGYAVGPGNAVRVETATWIKHFRVHVNAGCKRITKCGSWFKPQFGPACCNGAELCPQGEEGCCSPTPTCG